MNHIAKQGKVVIKVNPKHSSQECRNCGHTDKSNRDGEKFICAECGFHEHADIGEAKTIKSNPSSPIYFVEVQFQPDKKLYSRLFTEIFLYLDKTELTNNWRGVVVYPSRNIDVGETQRYIELLTSGRITRIYLDQLDSTPSPSIAIGTVKLVVEPESSAVTKAKELINLAKQQIASEITQREFLELIETIIVYKFPQKSREEIEQMFGFSELKQTKVYQEAKQEGKLEAVPLMLNLGATVEQIAEALELDVELVRLVAAKVNTNEEKSTSG